MTHLLYNVQYAHTVKPQPKTYQPSVPTYYLYPSSLVGQCTPLHVRVAAQF